MRLAELPPQRAALNPSPFRALVDGRGAPLRFLCRGDAYRFWGLFEAHFHLVCPAEGGTLFLLGTDWLGRDMLSRIIYGARGRPHLRR